MATDNFFGRQEANTEDFILMIKSTDLEKCFGMMEQFTKDFGQKEFKTVLV
jgi:hypothetical protein